MKLLARNRRHGKPYPCSPRSFAQKGTNRSETWIWNFMPGSVRLWALRSAWDSGPLDCRMAPPQPDLPGRSGLHWLFEIWRRELAPNASWRARAVSCNGSFAR